MRAGRYSSPAHPQGCGRRPAPHPYGTGCPARGRVHRLSLIHIYDQQQHDDEDAGEHAEFLTDDGIDEVRVLAGEGVGLALRAVAEARACLLYTS